MNINSFNLRAQNACEVSKSTNLNPPLKSIGLKQDGFSSGGVYGFAKDFKKNVINLFVDWKTNFPKDGEAGCQVLEKTLTPYTEQLKTLKQPDAQYFTKLCFGKETLQALEDGSLINSTVKNFKDVLEQGMGSTVKDLIKAYK